MEFVIRTNESNRRGMLLVRGFGGLLDRCVTDWQADVEL